MPLDEPLTLIEATDEMLDRHDMATRDALEGIEGAYMFLTQEVINDFDDELRQERVREIVDTRVEIRGN